MSTRLFDAIAAHDVALTARLLNEGADPNESQEQWPGWRPLHAAIEELQHGGSIDVVVLLILHRANVNLWDTSHDATPLLMACFRAQYEAIRVLLAAGADPNVVGSEGDSPLRWAVDQGELDLVRLFLAAGAAASIDHAGGFSGETALELAASRLDIETLRLLVDAGADPAAPASGHRTPVDLLPTRDETNAARWDQAAAIVQGRG